VTAATTPLSVPTVENTAKARLLPKFQREHATTLKILRAFPADQASLRPNDKCNSAQQLAATFVIEEKLMLDALKGQQVLASGFPSAPGSWNEIIDEFDRVGQKVVAELQSSADANLVGTTTFFVGPKQMGDIPREAFVDAMIHDQIHHRGQLSIYVRMAGAKLPSIYGPTADEPWN